MRLSPILARAPRLLALTHRTRQVLDEGEVLGYADLARLTGVARARISQIMDLLLLAPDIQGEILFLPGFAGRETISERSVRCIVAFSDWSDQRAEWPRAAHSRQSHGFGAAVSSRRTGCAVAEPSSRNTRVHEMPARAGATAVLS